MATTLYTQSQRTHAEMLVGRRHAWTRATRKSDGLQFFIFESSQLSKDGKPKGYMATARGCTCPGYLYRGRCCHQLAVSLVEQAAKPKPVYKSYAELYPVEDDGDYGNCSAF